GQSHERRAPTLHPLALGEAPAAHVVRAGDDAGANAFGDPRRYYKMADLRAHAQQVAERDAQSFGVGRMDPERIVVCDLVQPFRIATSRMDEHGQAEGWDEHE